MGADDHDVQVRRIFADSGKKPVVWKALFCDFNHNLLPVVSGAYLPAGGMNH